MELGAMAGTIPDEITEKYVHDRITESKNPPYSQPKTKWAQELESINEYICNCFKGKVNNKRYISTFTVQAGLLDVEKVQMKSAVECTGSKISGGFFEVKIWD